MIQFSKSSKCSECNGTQFEISCTDHLLGPTLDLSMEQHHITMHKFRGGGGGGGGGGTGVRTNPLKNHKNIVFFSNIGPDP